MKSVIFILLLALIHTWPYWDINEKLVGRPGDTFVHAAIGEWYCKNIVTNDFHFDGYMAPNGVNLAGNYDSPFPFILTCPFIELGSQAQFHLFAFFQILLILMSAWLVSGLFFKTTSLRWAYLFLTWFCSFYLVRSHIHLTLLSVIWGFQLSLFAVFNYDKNNTKKVVTAFVLLSLSMCGTFQNLMSLFLIHLFFIGYVFSNLKNYTGEQRIRLLYGVGAGAVIFLFFWGPMLLFTLNNSNPLFSPADLRPHNSLNLKGLFLPFGTNVIGEYLGTSNADFEKSNAIDWVVFSLFLILLIYKKFRLKKLEWLAVAIAAFYLIISFGPEVYFNSWIFEFYPFKISRTPSRLATVSHLILIVLTLKFIENTSWTKKMKNVFGFGLSIWALSWGPAANNIWLAPTFKYKHYLPQNALDEIKHTSTNETVVVTIPSAWGDDSLQNFLRLFHGQKITSAYLAFPAYNLELVAPILKDSFLSQIDCGSSPISFKNGEIMNNSEKLKQHLSSKRYDFTIINKQYLSTRAGCEPLKLWIFQYLKYPWVKVLQENNNFIVTKHLF